MTETDMPVHNWTRVTAGTFHDFHSAWITHIKESLNTECLPPGFYAMAEQHAGQIVPDILALTSPEWTSESNAFGSASHEGDVPVGAVALAEAPPQVSLRVPRSEAEASRQKRRTISIRQEPDNRVVAVIEIVSPANKDCQRSVEQFVNKTIEMLDRGIHVLVVDLFPPNGANPDGIHAAIWQERAEIPEDRPLTLVSYCSREVSEAFIEPVSVGQVLPDMPVFLDPGWYINVPLEETYQSAWRGVPAPYQRVLEDNESRSES